MGREIERKFLVANDGWRGLAVGVEYRQGYLCAGLGKTVRVRLAGDQAFLTIKGPTEGISRLEYEYSIPLEDARQMLALLCPKPQIEKKRHRIAHEGLVWEVDEFFGLNQGLVIAEIELSHEGQPFAKPDWVGQEVSDDRRYSNAALCQRPYSAW